MRPMTMIAVFAALSLAPGLARAQIEPTKSPVPFEQILSANPIGLPFKWLNAEYERKLDTATTWGVSGSTFHPVSGDAVFADAKLLLRYYPQGAALSGFYVGGNTGVYRFHLETAPTRSLGAGLDIGYAWLFGAKRNVSVSLGLGATRIFAEDFAFAYPRLLNIGIAF